MHSLRSRVGVIAVAIGGVAALSVPVVAAGQVPSVDQTIGGVTDQLPSVQVPSLEPVAPAPAPAPVPQIQVPAPPPAPSLPAPLPSLPGTGSGPAQPSPSQPAPSQAAPSQPASGAQGGSSESLSASGREGAGTARAAAAKKRADRRVEAKGSADEPAGAARKESADVGATASVAQDAAALPDDASPETSPFTGFRLGVLAMLGLLSLAGGLALRRSMRGGFSFARR